ncbi:MAG: alkaline phosphatase D family protein [Planctomycetota bacterium]
MTHPVNRRRAIQTLAAGATIAGASGTVESDASAAAATSSQPAKPSDVSRVDNWNRCLDRVFLGGDLWANPMEDWSVQSGRAVVGNGGGFRNIQLLTHQLTNTAGELHMSVEIETVQYRKTGGGAGFRVGVRSEINEVRSNCFAKNGWSIGIIDGHLRVGPTKGDAIDPAIPRVRLEVHGVPIGDGRQMQITLRALAPGKDGDDDSTDTTVLGTATAPLSREQLLGNVALVSNFDARLKVGRGSRYAFSNWQVGGDAFTVDPSATFGPIMWTQYTLSDSRGEEGFVLRLSALIAPMGQDDNRAVDLQVQRDGTWQTIATEDADPDAWTAVFHVPNWDESRRHDYRVVYKERLGDNDERTHEFAGVVRENPSGRPLRLAAMTCQNDYGFPYAPVAENIIRMDPDMLYFSGDQLYENHGGFGVVRQPADRAIINYLRKFYQHGWAFRDAIRNAPTVCIPDDHDVFQGNIWGENGKPMGQQSTSSAGGYRQPPSMVNVVHLTCAGHHPKPYDAQPCLQDISVYYGDLVYGGVSFAVLGDRQFKSGPERVDTGPGRADHVIDPDFDLSDLDQPGLILLGDRQEQFLKAWADDWRGASMKVVLSQTVFAAVATHHGSFDGFLKADLDSGGWPQTPRNRAVELLRAARALHINGDQHLTTMVQYGTEKQRDAGWSFCTPAISAGYPRWWRPDEVGISHENRPQHGLPNTGEFADAFENFAYAYSVGNPQVGKAKNRYEKAHEKGSGFGFVVIDTTSRTYTCHAFRFNVDPTKESDYAETQFPGWPLTIHQSENAGNNRIG